MSNKKAIVQLPRGGFLVETSEGLIQFGVPPETVKDTMVTPKGVPRIFVLPQEFFYFEKGISVAEIEFPLYFNFFLKQLKSKIICQKDRIKDMQVALHEAAFGPEETNLEGDFTEEYQKYLPDLRKELAFFRRGLQLNELVGFIPFENGSASLGKVTIEIKDNGDFALFDSKELIANIPGTIQFHLKYDVDYVNSRHFMPPRMGVTCLGPSHGFDPEQNTSGFILWLNNRGIMIDPPVTSTEWLRKSNVNPKYIDSIILTHCHADHDAGTFQKILAEEKITLYTTQTIINSFLRKYSALTKINTAQLQEMFRFQPLLIGKPVLIHQGVFDFFYTLHSIPTIGFSVNFRGKTFAYSSDHLNDPELIKKLHEDEILTDGRVELLNNFPWHCDQIYHEAGIPPIHTPIKYLNSLPKALQKRMMVYHIAEKDFPKETDLTLAKRGIEETKLISVPNFPYDNACDILHILEKVEYFNSFTLPKISELLSILQKEYFLAGDTIIKQGTPGDKFYIIISGQVSVEGMELNSEKKYGDYETFGEASLLLNQPRYATVVAETNITAVTIDKEAFLHLLQGTQLRPKLERLSQSRDEGTWETLNDSPFFKHTTSFQKTAFETILKPYSATKDEILINQGDPFEMMYLIKEGTVRVYTDKGEKKELVRGDLVGDIVQLQTGKTADMTCKAKIVCELYQINRNDMLEYIETYPNIYMNLLYNKA